MPRRLLDPAFYAPPAAPLILAIGDSFTQGFPVRAEDAYPAVLQRVLAARGVVADVRNAGMGDSGPDQQLRLLATHLLPKLHPAVVVWQLFANDVWDNLTKSVYRLEDDRLIPVSGARHWIADRARVFDWTPLPRGIKRQSRLFRVVLHAFERREQPTGDPVQWSLAKLDRELDELERLARVHGFVPYVLLVPPQSMYLAQTDPAWNQRWSAVENGRIAALLQPRPAAIDGYLGDGRADTDFASVERDPQDRGDHHLNERGYARLAALVARRMRSDGVPAGAWRGSSRRRDARTDADGYFSLL